MDRLGEAFDQNTEVFSESLKMTEAMYCVLQRALNDQAEHGEYTYADCGMPDWHAYMRYFWLCQTVSDFARWLGSLQATSEERALIEVSSSLERASVGDRVVETHIFGG